MRKLIVNQFVTLDGVMQSPTSPSEDTENGFAHGGWHGPHMGDTRFQRWLAEAVAGAGGFLFGRRTFEAFAAYWPTAPDAEQILAAPLNARQKYIASTTLAEPLAWQPATLLPHNLAGAVAALKQEPGDYLLVVGSSRLVAALLAHDLVDEIRLMIDPVAVGGGKRLFVDDGKLRLLRLVDCEATATGAILATYAKSV